MSPEKVINTLNKTYIVKSILPFLIYFAPKTIQEIVN